MTAHKAPRAFEYIAERNIRRRLHDSTLSLRAQQIATAFLDHVDENGEAWCSVRTLAHECRAKTKTVMAIFAELVARGFMFKTGDKRGKGGTPVYRFTGRLDDNRTVAPIETTVSGDGTVVPSAPNCSPSEREL